MTDQPEIVCLSGSMRFAREMQKVAGELTAEGVIVVMPHATVHVEDRDGSVKAALEELHFRKIDLARRLVVVQDESGYYGESTKREIEYAIAHGKRVENRRLLSDDEAAVERMAQAMRADWALRHAKLVVPWGQCQIRIEYKHLARAALTALKEGNR